VLWWTVGYGCGVEVVGGREGAAVWELKQAARAGLRLRITSQPYQRPRFSDHAPDYQHFTCQASAFCFETERDRTSQGPFAVLAAPLLCVRAL
jgi:hypothetical protein